MKEENYNVTQSISSHYEYVKELPNKVFFLENECTNQIYKVTTKTDKLAIQLAEECESSVYDAWANDDVDVYGLWVGNIKVVDFNKIDENASIWDLDDGYSFEWCEWPKEKKKKDFNL